jgi:hypothetical protein
MFPAAVLIAGPPNKVFPPTMMVMMPNATATSAAAMVQRGRRDIVSIIGCLILAAESAVNFALAQAPQDKCAYQSR